MRFGAFLRGVNLGSHRRVSGAELKSIFEGIGFEGVATFRASGNVVFEAPRRSPEALTKRIEAGIADATGFESQTFLRSENELEAIVASSPLTENPTRGSKGRLQVLLLPAKPGPKAKREVLALATDADRLAFGPRELYWLPTGGTIDSALDRNRIEDLIGPTTARTKGTIDQLFRKYFQLS